MDEDLEQLGTEVTTALAGLNARQTQATPPDGPEKWNIQQNIEHLLMTMRGSAAAVQVCLQGTSPALPKSTLAQRFAQWFVLGRGIFPSGRKASATATPTLLTALRSGDELAEKVHGALLQFDGVAAETERLLGRERAAPHPVLGPLSMRQWRRFHLVHGRHHLRQIWRIREARGF